MKNVQTAFDTLTLSSLLVSRCCEGMEKGDRFYSSSDDTWWEWKHGHLHRSGPPKGYKQKPKRGT